MLFSCLWLGCYKNECRGINFKEKKKGDSKVVKKK